VVVDPGTIPVELFESELFGYSAGAFTGALRASPGKVGRAQGGTLLLDHVETFPLSVQPKLLRLIAERRYACLGGGEVDADLRFLAVASPDLLERVHAGAFRADLFYRLEVIAFTLPPLRRRPQDVLPLACRLLADLGQRFGRPGLRLSAAAEAWLPNHSWPGNGRQLRNVLERELILSQGEVLDPKPSGEGAPVTLRQLEREHILKALAFTRGHQAKAAALLGISRKALWEKRRRLGLP
jgi:DNA-binding NtrC family response regulator